jgi:RNA polymerase sigma-70 factor (ECF subfamily)
VGSDEALVDGLRARHPAAVSAFCERYSAFVLRLLGRILGADPELRDLHHDVFVRALRSAHTVRDAATLQGWIGTIAVNVARERIRSRSLRRWLVFLPAEQLPEPLATRLDDGAEQLSRRTYQLLEKLPREQRIALALRWIDGMTLSEVAAACEVSLATIKRRLTAGERRFRELGRADPVLSEWLAGGGS